MVCSVPCDVENGMYRFVTVVSTEESTKKNHFKRKINDTYLDRPPNMQDAYCSKSLVFLSTATPLTSRKKQVWMSTVLAKNVTRDLHSIVSFLQKQWTIQEPKLHLLHQSFNAANREPVSLGLKIELKGNS